MSKASISASDTAVGGVIHGAGGAEARPARFSVDAAGVAAVTVDDEVAARAPMSDLDISDRVGSIARRIVFPDGSLFETADNDGVDRALGRRGPGLVATLERFHPRLIAVVAAVIALSAALYRFAVPLLVEIAVAVTPPAVPNLIGGGTLASLDQFAFSATTLDAKRQHVLADGFNDLARLTPRGVDGFRLHFRAGGAIGPNAFALPDGAVILTDELVALAGSDDEMLLGVLAHEIGHVEHVDTLRQLYSAAGAAAMIMLIAGDIGAGAEDVLTQGAALASLSYSRRQEASADRYSVELMHRAGKDPAAIARLFRLLEKELGDSGGGAFFSTHPDTPDRIEAVERMAAEIRLSR